MVVSSIKELRATLSQETQNILFSQIESPLVEPQMQLLENFYDKQSNPMNYQKQLLELANLYIKGHRIDWKGLHQGETHQRISLPTYPFLKESYWLTEDSINKPSRQLHPLLDENVSTLNEQCFKTILTCNEFYLTDHIVGGRKVLPGVVYLEMARAAGDLALPGKRINSLQDIVWANPLVAEGKDVEVNIRLKPQEGQIQYVIFSQSEGEEIFHGQGALVYGESYELMAWSTIPELKLRLTQDVTGEEIYSYFSKFGLDHGPSFQVLQWAKVETEEVLAYYTLPSGLKDAEQYCLHPSIMDGALQAVAVRDLTDLMVPFSLEKLTMNRKPDATGYVHVKRKKVDGVSHLSIQILDTKGGVCVELEGFKARAMIKKSKAELDYYTPQWKAVPLTEQENVMLSLCVIGADELFVSELKKQLPHLPIIHLQNGPCFVQVDKNTYQLRLDEKEDYALFIQAVREENIAFSHFILGNKSEPDIAAFINTSLLQSLVLLQSLMQAKVNADLHFFLPYHYEAARLEPGIMFTGLAKSLYQEHSRYRLHVVGFSSSIFVEQLVNEVARPSRPGPGRDALVTLPQHVRYVGHERQVEHYARDTSLPISGNLPLRQKGVVLMTGGLGGLGLIFAEYLAKTYQARLVLTGRSELTVEKQRQLDQLEEFGAEILYLQGDVTDQQTVEQWIALTKARFGSLQGIIHSAGIVEDRLLFQKDLNRFKSVIQPKVLGAVYLDAATAEENLDYFVVFSSLAGCFGNAGQTDYATGNAFLDAFANWRTEQAKQGKRFGKSLSINWPLWANGGMTGNEMTIQALQAIGIETLSTDQGIIAFEECLSRTETAQSLVVYGIQQQISSLLEEQVQFKPVSNQKQPIHADFLPKIIEYLKEKIAKLLKMPLERLKDETPFERYGMDSMMIVNLTRHLEEEIGKLPKTLFFEYQNVKALAGYFMEHHADVLKQKINPMGVARPSRPGPGRDALVTLPQLYEQLPSEERQSYEVHSNEPIAVIGLSGRYPQANNIEELWSILKASKDCVTEVPADRWPDQSNPVNKDGKWGGFIANHDKFDPLFFNMSPQEAETTDPQERLFLEVAWQTLEDAGYTPEKLNQQIDSSVGVFVGVMYGSYQLYGAEVNPSYASIANRVSYFLNLQGPSLAVDTMCSSSLTALHLACKSVQRGECKVAIAGGVNISTHQNKYLFLGKGQFLSSEGKCKSFAEGGDGYVPGEGVGAVLLKPLSEALKDGDRIYGLIRGSSINHGGFSNGYTTPNPNAQAKVIAEAFRDAGVSAESISYLETHGTGTSLGDPIEIRGLSKAFGKAVPLYSCPIGSIKSNVGHLESAAGIVALTKVLLQLKHKQLVPSIHSETLNPFIEFDQTPFFVQQEISEWKAKPGYKLRAGISSFGAGGSNAHLIVEEGPEYILSHTSTKPYYLLTLSAKHPDSLNQMIKDLGEYLDQDLPLEAIAYTLNAGRTHFEYRLAMVVSSIEELRTALKSIRQGQSGSNTLISEASQQAWHEPIFEELLERLLEDLSSKQLEPTHYRKKLLALADLYIKGYEIDWKALHKGEAHQRISLPTYSFLKESYWMAMPKAIFNRSSIQLHPLLDSNASTLNEQCFRTVLTGNEFYLSDHVVGGNKILPGAVYLEMARAAGDLALPGKKVSRLQDIVWVNPLVIGSQDVEVNVRLEPQEGKVRYLLYSRVEGEEIVHGHGILVYEEPQPLTAWSTLSELKIRLAQDFTKEEIYAQFSKIGLQYGPTFQPLQWAKISKEEGLAYYALPGGLNMSDEYCLHPSILDGALQTCAIGVLSELALPFALENLTVSRKPDSAGYIHLKRKNDLLSLQILDSQGVVCVQLEGLKARSLGKESMAELAYYAPQWQTVPIGEQKSLMHSLCVIGADGLLFTDLKKQFSNVPILRLQSGPGYLQIDKNTYQLRLDKKEDYALFIQAVRQENIEFSHFVLSNDPEQDIAVYIDTQVHQSVLLLQSLMQAKVDADLHFVLPYHYEATRLEPGVMFSGLAKSLAQENPRYQLHVVGLNSLNFADQLVKEVKGVVRPSRPGPGRDALVTLPQHVRYVVNERQVEQYVRDNIPQIPDTLPLRQKGVYLITGGLGGLGLIFAEYLAKTYQARLVLTGRSELTAEKRSQLSQLEESGGEVLYLQGDVSDQLTVEKWVKATKERFGSLQGVMHSAGIVDDRLLLQKEWSSFKSVILPKVLGTAYLDAATANENLECFVLFSSLSSCFGNIGQTDYATGNAFLDTFANWRTEQVKQGKRFGRSLSINWPLWDQGGMHVDEAIEQYLLQEWGLLNLPNAMGIEALIKNLAMQSPQVLTLYGDQNRIAQVLKANISFERTSTESAGVASELLIEKTLQYLKEKIAATLKLPMERFKEDMPFERYGLDSMRIVALTRRLEEDLGYLPKTLFFEYQNAKALAEYLARSHREGLEKKLNLIQPVQASRHAVDESKIIRSDLRKGQMPERKTFDDRIAIIGLSGRYPMADNLDEFWGNLLSGKDCVTGIPQERWKTYSPYEQKKNGEMWGGFIANHDKFDPLFFNISPREAEIIDPQERLFLEVAWQTLEDAGYTPEGLNQGDSQAAKRAVGVFVGVMYSPYQLYGAEESLKGNELALSSSFSSIANRVSYCLNLQGPSLAVDTMCSSSLTALHLACMSLRSGECETALAGGVNIASHLNKYLLLSQNHFLSSDGKCRSFGEGGDGYVPGEGVGTVLLKPLSQAIIDGDRVYGVIRGSSVNHGGFSNNYTVPNPNAQASLIESALKKGDISPESISYVETHGTGTSLGDPIEIRGLSKAFGEAVPLQSCPIGSVKSNIGHLESAAGIVALTKVLLQLKHKQLVPSIHSQTLNSYIKFDQTPFYVQQEISDWKTKTGTPRRAGISSFGAGGSNAHLIIEEGPDYVLSTKQSKPSYLLTLSAKHPDSLKQKIKDLHAYLNKHSELPLEAIAYTLNAGRSHFEFRLAMVVSSLEEVQSALENAGRNEMMPNMLFSEIQSQTKHEPIFDEILERLLEDFSNKQFEPANYRKKLLSLADLYIKGYEIDWKALHKGEAHQRISLPTYPFLKESYWISTTKATFNQPSVQFHPLLGSNVSTLNEQCFQSVLRALSMEKKSIPIGINEDLLPETTVTYLKEKIAATLKLPIERLREDLPFERYGLDSVRIVALTRQLEEDLGNLRKTLFFEYQNVKELAEYLISSHREALEKKLNLTSSSYSDSIPKILSTSLRKETLAEKSIPDDRIAIIGMSGRYPMADNLDEFWEHLMAGKDCVTEIPQERWDATSQYNPNKGVIGKSYSKWGGFIADHDKFDPLFFNISPREAEILDPQERLFLEVAWQTLEDAGYTPEGLNQGDSQAAKRAVGVFVGVMYGPYQLFGAEENAKGSGPALSSSFASIANRVSYCLNLHGPSLAVDTMCSSSLTALHLACMSLLSGECKTALAGGVNIASHANKYLLLSQGRFLATDGKCKSFGEGGDGYVPGEGVGAVLLKPLSQAILDGDRIYGVIRGSSVNHGGFSNNYTVPNPNAQASLIDAALKKANISPDSISYVETHGTGTSLGDPIEIRGLSQAFGEAIPLQSCPIGSVKSNIGHLESAAGIAALTKVLLQLKHQQLVPSIHSENLNPYIEFEETPFYVQREIAEWKSKPGYPRRAGISSFGAGGSNAHLIVEEGPEYVLSMNQSRPFYLITVSAKHPDSLKQKIADLCAYLNKHPDLPLEAIAYTLNAGRGHFSYRCAWVVSSKKVLQEQLDDFQASKNLLECFQGKVGSNDEHTHKQLIEDSVQLLKRLDVQDPTKYQDVLESLASLYVKGCEIDWKTLHKNESQQRISLPAYPFLKERYWVPATEEQSVPSIEVKIEEPIFLHDETEELLSATQTYLKNILAAAAKLPLDRIEANQPLEIYGIDSVMITTINQRLNQDLPDLRKTLLFEYRTLESLANYLIQHCPDHLRNLLGEGVARPSRPGPGRDALVTLPQLLETIEESELDHLFAQLLQENC